jgi:excinuclease ABC subunit C
MSSALKETVVSFPSDPGVYIMKDAKGDVIYVGKAKDLRKRVSSYFLSRRDIKTSHLVGNIASIEYILTRPNTRHSSSKTTSSSSGNRVITST